MSNEIRVRPDGSQVPALRHDPATQLDQRDLALPRLYIAQDMHNAVQDGLVKRGSIFVATDSDDPDPVVLAEPGSEDGVRFHVLGLRKGKSISIDGELFTYAYGDPDAPAEAWTTYSYLTFVPAYGNDVPVKWLLTRTGRPTAQKINTVLARSAGKRPSFTNAFVVTTAQKQNDKGRFFVPRVQPVEAVDADLADAESLYETFVGADEAPEAGNEPAI